MRTKFIQISLLIGMIIIIIFSLSATIVGFVLYKQGKLNSLLANVSQVSEEEEPAFSAQEQTENVEQIKQEENPQEEESELEQAMLEAERTKEEAERLKQELKEQKEEVQQEIVPVASTQEPISESVIQSTFSDIVLEVSGNNKKDERISGGTEGLKSLISVPFNTYRKIVLRKISLEIIKNHYAEPEPLVLVIQGSEFQMEKRGNYLVWEGYKELSGSSYNLFTIYFSVEEKHCFLYKIDSDSLKIFERIEHDMQNIFQPVYSEKPIKLIGNFPFYSEQDCNTLPRIK
jgi:hypothetical protein